MKAVEGKLKRKPITQLKYGATTNIVVVQYDPNDVRRARPEIGKIDNGFGRFKVINHIEIPKSDMQYDIAVQTVKRLDKKYDPFAIRVDRGAGKYVNFAPTSSNVSGVSTNIGEA